MKKYFCQRTMAAAKENDSRKYYEKRCRDLLLARVREHDMCVDENGNVKSPGVVIESGVSVLQPATSRLLKAYNFWQEFVHRSEARVIVVTGNSRTGKTSALLHLEKRYRGTNIYVCPGDYGNALQKSRADYATKSTLASRVQYIDYIVEQILAIESYEKKSEINVVIVVFDRFILAEPLYEWLYFCKNVDATIFELRKTYSTQILENVRNFVNRIGFDEIFLMDFLYSCEKRISWFVVVPEKNESVFERIAVTDRENTAVNVEKIYDPKEYVIVQSKMYESIFPETSAEVTYWKIKGDYENDVFEIERQIEAELWIKRKISNFRSIFSHSRADVEYEQPVLLFDRFLDKKPHGIWFRAVGGVEKTGKTQAYVRDMEKMFRQKDEFDDEMFVRVPDLDYTRCVMLADNFKCLSKDLLGQKSVLPIFVYFESLLKVWEMINQSDEYLRYERFEKTAFHLDRTPACYAVYALIKNGVFDLEKPIEDNRSDFFTLSILKEFLTNGKFIFSGFDEETWLISNDAHFDFENQMFEWIKNEAKRCLKREDDSADDKNDDKDSFWPLPFKRQKTCTCTVHR